MEDGAVAEGRDGVLSRAVAILRALAAAGPDGLRLSDIADAAGLPKPTALRILRNLQGEGLVEDGPSGRTYRLGLDLFCLAARAGNPAGLRDLGRPAMLRVAAAFEDTVFLLVRSGYDAVLIDRSEGVLPVRSLTGDIGGKVPLGLGQGSTAILASLPAGEQEEIVRHNLPLIRERGGLDETALRAALLDTARKGYCDVANGLIPGSSGLAVPIRDRTGQVVAALSIGTTLERLTPERRAAMAEMLQREAAAIGDASNPFDPTLRRPGASMQRAG